MWQRGWMYVRKAGTIILGVSIVMWALMSFPRAPAEVRTGASAEAKQRAALQYSAAGRVGRALEAVTEPLGFDWRINTGLIAAFAAKEVFVAQMGIVLSLGEEVGAESESLHAALRRNYTPLQGMAVMVFSLLCFPCMATAAVMWRETGSWKWVAFQWVLLTAVAYLAALVIYQGGMLLGLGGG